MPAEVEEWRRLFPGVDVLVQFRRMRAWSEANRTRRKTKQGIRVFVTRWLDQEQNQAGSGGRREGMRGRVAREYIETNLQGEGGQ